MHIAVISHWGFKKLHGGTIRAYFLVRELLRREHHVTIILADPDDSAHCEAHFGCKTICVNEPMSRWQSVRMKMTQYMVFGRKVRRVLDHGNFDAVFGINLIQALPAVRQRGAESWIMYVDLWADFFAYDAAPTPLNRLIASIVRRLEFHTMRRADKLVMITEAMRTLIPRDTRAKVKIIPDGADVERFSSAAGGRAVRARYGLEDAPVFSYQGGIARHEGLDLLCRAAPHVLKELPEARFLIVGRGDFLDTCKDMVKTNGSAHAFVFTGWVDYSEMPDMLNAVDISVVPMPDARAARPIISFKLLEAMAARKLVVANRLPGLCEIVDDDMAVLTRADDSVAFARGLVDAWRLPNERKRALIQRAFERIQELSWPRIAERDADYYTES